MLYGLIQVPKEYLEKSIKTILFHGNEYSKWHQLFASPAFQSSHVGYFHVQAQARQKVLGTSSILSWGSKRYKEPHQQLRGFNTETALLPALPGPDAQVSLLSLLDVPVPANGYLYKILAHACVAHSLTPFSPAASDQTTDGQASQSTEAWCAKMSCNNDMTMGTCRHSCIRSHYRGNLSGCH